MNGNFEAKYFLMGEQKQNSRLARKLLKAAVLAALYSGGLMFLPDNLLDNSLAGYGRAYAEDITITSTQWVDHTGNVVKDAGTESSLTANLSGHILRYKYLGGWNASHYFTAKAGTISFTSTTTWALRVNTNTWRGSGTGPHKTWGYFNANSDGTIMSGYENSTVTITGTQVMHADNIGGSTYLIARFYFGGKNVTLTGTSGTAFYYGNNSNVTNNVIGINAENAVINGDITGQNNSRLVELHIYGGTTTLKGGMKTLKTAVTVNNGATLQLEDVNGGKSSVGVQYSNVTFNNSGTLKTGGIAIGSLGFTNNGTGKLNMGSGNINVTGNFANSGTVDMSSGNISVSGTFTNNNSGKVNMSSGSISANSFTNSGTLNKSTGSFSVTNTFTNNATGVLNMANNSADTITLGTFTSNSGTMKADIDLSDGAVKGDKIIATTASGTINLGNQNIFGSLDNIGDTKQVQIVSAGTNTVSFTGVSAAVGSDHFRYSVENGTNNGYVKVTKLDDYYSLYSIINNKQNAGDAGFNVAAITLYTLNNDIVLTDDSSKELKYYETTTSSSQSTATGLGTLTGRDGGEFTLDGDSHTLDGGSQNGITVQTDSGALNLKNITLTNFSGDIVTNNGTVNIIGNVVMDGSIGGTGGTLNIAAGNTLTMTGSSGNITGQTTFVNAGTLKIGSGTLGSTLTNTGNLELNGTELGAEINGDGKTVIKATSILDNTTNNVLISQKDLTIESNAQLTTSADKLVITNAVDNKGKLLFTGGNIASNIGTTTTEGGMEIQGDVTNTDNKTIKLKTLTVSSGSFTTALENLTVSDANIINKGILNLSSAVTADLANNITNDSAATGTLNITAGDITNTGKKTITQNSLEIVGGSSLTTEVDALAVVAITNNGTLNLTADGTSPDTLEETVGGTGTLNFKGDKKITASGTVGQTTVNVNTDVDMDNTLTAGTINIASAKTLFIDADNLKGDVANSGTVKFDGDGTLASGYTITGGNIDVSANVTAGADDIKGTATVQSGYTLTLNSGTLTEPITNNGTVDLTGVTGLTGAVTGGILNIKQNLQTNANNIIGNTNNVETGYTLTLNSGTLAKEITNSGMVELTGIDGLTAAVTGGTLNIKQNLQTSADNIKGNTNSVDTAKTLTLNSGTLAKAVTGAGALNISGSVTATPEYIGAGTNTISASGNLTLTDGTLNKEISGAGTLNFNGNVSTNANYIKTETNTVASGKNLTLSSGTLTRPVTNSGTVKFAGATEMQGTVVGGTLQFASGNVTVENAAHVAGNTNTIDSGVSVTVNSGTLTKNITNSGSVIMKEGSNIGVGGKIDGGDVTLNENVNFTAANLANIGTLTANNAIYNFNADMGTTPSVEKIYVNTKATGTLKLGKITITDSDVNWEAGVTKQVQYLEGGTDNNITLGTTITVTSDRFKYTFGQGYNTIGDSTSGYNIGYMDVKKDNGYTLAQIIQNYEDTTTTPSFHVGIVDTYTLIEDYTETDDLGNLTRLAAGTARTFSIEGNKFNFLGNGFEGITVGSGDTLNLNDISEISGWENGTAISNSGTVNLSGNIVLNDKLVGTGAYTNNGDLTVADASKLQMTSTDGLVNRGTLNLGNATNSELGANVTGYGTINIKGEVTSAKNISNSVVIEESKKLTNTGIISGAVENKGTFITTVSGITGSVKNTGSMELNGTGAALACDITDDAVAKGTTVIDVAITNPDGKTIAQKNLIINSTGSLSTAVDKLTVSDTITDDGTLRLTETGNLQSKVIGSGDIYFDGNISTSADYIALTDTGIVTVETDKNLTLDGGSLAKAITNNGTVKFAGAIAMQAAVSGGILDFASGTVAVTDVAYIAGTTNKIESGATAKLISGTLNTIITGAGNIVVGDGVSTETVTATLEKIANTGTLSVDNKATLILTGNNTLARDIGGTGTTKLDGTLTVLSDQTITGTLDGNGQTLKMTNDAADSTINTLTVGKLKGNLHLQLDVDMTAFTADKLAAGAVDSGADVTIDSINVTKDLTLTTLEVAKTENNKIVYLTENGGTPIHGTYNVSGDSITKTVTNGYEYTFTKGNAGTLNYTVAGISLTLKNFIEGTLPEYNESPATEIDPATLSLTNDMEYTETAANAADANQLNNTLNINLNGHNLTNSSSVMTVSTGNKTLNINGGTEGNTDLNFNVADGGALAISGEIKLSGTLSGAGNFSNEGTLTMENAANLQMTGTNGLMNSGTLNLGNATNSELGANVTGDGTINIKGEVTSAKIIENKVVIGEEEKLTNTGTIRGMVENAGTFITTADGITGGVKNTGSLEINGDNGNANCDITDEATAKGTTTIKGNVKISGDLTQKTITIADGKSLTIYGTLTTAEGTVVGSGSKLLIGVDRLKSKVVNSGTVNFVWNGTMESGYTISGGTIEFGDTITADDEGNFDDIEIKVDADDLKADTIRVLTPGAEAVAVGKNNILNLTDGVLVKTINNSGKVVINEGVAFGADGKIDGGEVFLKNNVSFTSTNLANIATLTSEEAVCNLNANVGSSPSIDQISVTTKATGTLKLGSVAVTDSDAFWDAGITKQVQYLVGGTDNDIVLTSTVTVSSDGFKYTFGQGYNTAGDSSSGNKIGYMDIIKGNGYGLYQIIQNYEDTTVTPSFYAGTVNTYTLVEDYTETNDLGALIRTDAGTARTFTVAGNNHKFLGNDHEGIAVNNGDTLNLSDISEISGWKNGIAVNNSGTVNFGGTVKLEDKLVGTGEYTNSGTLTVENIDNLAMTGTSGFKNSGILNLGKSSTEATLGVDITGVGTTNIKGDITNGRIIENKVVIATGNKLTNTGIISGTVENAGTFSTGVNGVTGGVKNTGSLKMIGENVDLQCDITDDTTPSGTTTILGTVTNSNRKTITQKELTIMNDGSLTTDADRIFVSENITNNGILALTGTGSISVKNIKFADGSVLKVDGNNIKDTAAISVTEGAEVESGAKLYIANAEKDTPYKILSGTGITDNGWNGADLVVPYGLALDETNSVRDTSEVTLQFQYNQKAGEGTAIPNIVRTHEGKVAEYIQKLSDRYLGDVDKVNKDLNALANLGENLDVTGGGSIVATMVGESITDHWQSVPVAETATVRNTAAAGEDYSVDTVKQGKVTEIMPIRAVKPRDEKYVWASYLHTKSKVDGLKLGNMDAKYNAQYNGVMAGVDLTSNFGIGIFHADGNITNQAGGHNNAKYYGGSIYGRKNFGKLNLYGDITYSHGKNEINQNDVTADARTNTCSVGLTAKYLAKAGRGGNFAPFVGATYVRIDSKEYTDSLGISRDADTTNSVMVPVGLEYTGEFVVPGSKWTWRPAVAVGCQFNLGDKDNEITCRYSGASDTFGYTFVDRRIFFTRIGMEFVKENLIFGFGYNFMKGSNSIDNKWNVNLKYNF